MAVQAFDSFSDFFNAHHCWLRQHLKRVMRNAADADDTAAETFCRVLAAAVDPDTIEQPRAYLAAVARRLLCDRYRRCAVEDSYTQHLGLAPEPVVPSPEQLHLVLEALARVDDALDGLPTPVRTAFLYSQLDSLGHAEIAQRLNVSQRTVGRYTTQALRSCTRSQLDS